MKKILVIQTASIGDVILSTPLLEKLNAFFEEPKIDMLLKKGTESLFRKHPFLDEIFIWDKSQYKYRNLYLIHKIIRRKKYDYVINLQRFFSTGLLTIFSGAVHTVGFNKNPLSLFFSKSVKHKIGIHENIHETQRNLSLIRHFTNDDFYPIKLHPAQDDYAGMSQYKTHAYICIAPASLWFTKQYPAEKWVELVMALKDHYIYFLGSQSDREMSKEIIRQSGHPNAINMCGKLSLLQTATLMADAKMNYVNDSAPQHIASAMNAPVTSIFCSTVPEFGFGPLSDHSAVVQSPESLACKPCGLHGYRECPEGHFKCALTIKTKSLLSRLN
ncbi:MAG: glycosyltransferase family 9 protein [Bacteroidales bacterium]|nr:glycosyltransferase family 9 protein [Bacteroidales bacterium]MCF8344956.1 glycosyltransferase family 9 protein [Bacteroidales bacterium]MCF8350700.1 glycosyltransferase family 9 protein [Bacteroidales bacterium]MCF8376993.1 glycosyltransferase family 9 protein [Bacteroidales bacterium]MCF8400854.1 glycosyltransferase family 9 protein [Bacteroidales bacterium]